MKIRRSAKTSADSEPHVLFCRNRICDSAMLFWNRTCSSYTHLPFIIIALTIIELIITTPDY